MMGRRSRSSSSSSSSSRNPRMKKSLLYLMVFVLSCSLSFSMAQEEGDVTPSQPDAAADASTEQQQQQQQQQDKPSQQEEPKQQQDNDEEEKKKKKKASSSSSSSSSSTTTSGGGDFDASNRDWGTYYDPQNIFCGKYDCYKILGLDYESSYGKDIDKKVITQRYRALSREWHPDKSKHRDAKERFVKIARAYEVLSKPSQRKEYDELRYDVEKYYMKYGTSVLWEYAPKSDTTFVIILLLVISNVFSWYSQKHRWQLVADRLIKASVEDWAPSQGGTPESKQLRDQALVTLQEREKAEKILASENNGTTTTTAASPSNASKKQKGTKKVSGKEKKRLEQEAIYPIVKEQVYKMDDFGGGFHKPTWRDLLIVSLAKLPFKISKEIMWFTMYYARRLRGLPLTGNEKVVLTQRAVGPLTWEIATEEEQQAMIKRELWVVGNLAEWSEEQEFNKLSASEKKEILRMKKKGIAPMDPSLLKED